MTRDPLTRILRGIEAGVVGGFAMLALFAVSSMTHRRVWWEIPNLLGSTFYHARAFSSGAGVATMAGIALQLTIAGSVGAVFGLACGNVRSRHRLILLGTLGGLLWFYLANALLWSHINPLVPLYWPEPAAVLSHLLFGACLGFAGTAATPPPLPNGPTDARPDAVES